MYVRLSMSDNLSKTWPLLSPKCGPESENLNKFTTPPDIQSMLHPDGDCHRKLPMSRKRHGQQRLKGKWQSREPRPLEIDLFIRLGIGRDL